MTRQEALQSVNDAFSAPRKHTRWCSQDCTHQSLAYLLVDSNAKAVAAAIAKVLAIIERSKQEWIRPSTAKPLPVGSHACELIAEEVRREFGVKE